VPVGVAVAEPEGEAVGVGDPPVGGDADADVVAAVDVTAAEGFAAPAWVDGPGFAVVGVRVGRGVDTGDGAGEAGRAPGGSAVPPSCQENATEPPAGTVSEPTPSVEYFQPEVPSDQYRPQ
jgi:hypothetical protein